MKKSPILLLIVATSFGEVDWILPVLSCFKKKYPEFKIITLFGHELVHQGVVQNKALDDEFSRISSFNIVPREIDALFEQIISPDQVKFILKDFNKDEYAPYKSYVTEKCPDALVVSYPHSNYIYSNRTSEPLKTVSDPDEYSKHDIFLLSSIHDIPFWSGRVAVDKIRAFGFPVLDRWWTEKLFNSTIFLESREKDLAGKAGKVFFHISRHPHNLYLSDDDYNYLIKSVVEEVFSYDDSLLLIKRHPRQHIESFEKLLESYDPARWMFSGLHLSQLSLIADLSISFWSSGILNSLSVNTPVIEFYRFGDANPDWRKLPDGTSTSIYREMGLAVPADSAQELHDMVESAFKGDDDIWELQKRAFLAHCQVQENASMAIVECLMAELENLRRKQDHASSDYSSFEQQIKLVEDFVAAGEIDKASRSLDDLVEKYPQDPRTYNNLGAFCFNQGEPVRAIENFLKALSYDPLHVESAVNLIQVMLELDRPTDAVNVVLSFYANGQQDNTMELLQNSLLEQLPAEQFDYLRQLVDARIADEHT